MEIISLRPEHLEAAAGLVATSFRVLRRQTPILPARYEDAAAIARLLRDLDDPAGVVALEVGRLVGFMTGFVLPEFLGKRSFYSPEWANGAEPGNSRRIYEEMYRHAAARWVADGCAVHAVTLMVHDRQGIEGWQWLGFGLAAVDGVRDLGLLLGSPTGLDVRQASLADAGEVIAFGRALEQHMADPPVLWPHDAEDYGVWLQQPDHAAWLAYEGGEPIGCLGLQLGRGGGCEIVQDERTASVIMAYTRAGARCQGIGTALVNQALAWARARGCQRCAVDWEPMNPPANRFWTRGFDPVCYSLLRWIEERVVARHAGPASNQDDQEAEVQ
jgi:GNAT superfamily N-acetyltransferase